MTDQIGFLAEPHIYGVPEALASQLAEIKVTPVSAKGPGAFKTISETAKLLDVPQHVLRFWESRFRQIRPLKLKGGRRYYRPEDVELLLRIKALLYQQGYTIKGARKALNESKRNKLGYLASIPAAAPEEDFADTQHDLLAQPVLPRTPTALQSIQAAAQLPPPASASGADKESAPNIQALRQELSTLKTLLSDALKE